MYSLAKFSALFKRSCVIEGYKFSKVLCLFDLAIICFAFSEIPKRDNPTRKPAMSLIYKSFGQY